MTMDLALARRPAPNNDALWLECLSVARPRLQASKGATHEHAAVLFAAWLLDQQLPGSRPKIPSHVLDEHNLYERTKEHATHLAEPKFVQLIKAPSQTRQEAIRLARNAAASYSRSEVFNSPVNSRERCNMANTWAAELLDFSTGNRTATELAVDDLATKALAVFLIAKTAYAAEFGRQLHEIVGDISQAAATIGAQKVTIRRALFGAGETMALSEWEGITSEPADKLARALDKANAGHAAANYQSLTNRATSECAQWARVVDAAETQVITNVSRLSPGLKHGCTVLAALSLAAEIDGSKSVPLLVDEWLKEQRFVAAVEILAPNNSTAAAVLTEADKYWPEDREAIVAVAQLANAPLLAAESLVVAR